jgi:carboxyl-terminal processing protease
MGGTTLEPRHPWRRGLLLAIVAVPLAYLVAPLTALAVDDKALLEQAAQYERAGDWGAAAEKYEEILRHDRTQTAIRDRYRHCLQRYFQVARLRDPSYRKDVLSLKLTQAMRLYEIVLFNLLNHSLDKDKVSPGLLFRKGLEEFRLALTSPEFCYDHLGRLKPEQTRNLRTALHNHYGNRKTMSFEQAVEAVNDVVMKSANHFPNINATTVVMEFVCGACLAMDDYTVYLTPRQLRELCDTLKGRYVGIGVRLKVEDNKILLAEVLPDSPAAEVIPGLRRDDHIVAIDKKSTMDMAPETAMDLLEGDAGTPVELVVASPVHGLRIVTLRRRALFVPSVSHELLPGGVGYIKIHCFQESTLQEFDTHLAELFKGDCKALILDLRGNPGGLLDVSIEIARRFLPTGIVLSTQHQDPKSSVVYRADNPTALTLPLVVLVDGDTASAAEVLAGALKENRRARVVGLTTYGKGCSQGLLKLPAEGALRTPAVTTTSGGTGGIRITVARFFSPSGRPYSGRGVEPDVVVAEADQQIYQGRTEAERMLMSMQ